MNIIEKLDRYQEETGESWSIIARGIGVSSSALSQFREGKYKGDNDKLVRKIESFIGSWQHRESGPRGLEFCMIRNAEEVFKIAKIAMAFGSLCMITSRAGYGKSEALKEFATQNENCFYLKVNETFNFITILKRVAHWCGVARTGNSDDIFQRIADKIKRSNRLLIIDEAHKLNFRALEITRDLHDDTEIGFVLAGDKTLYDRVIGRNNIRSDRNFDQLYSRISLHKELQAMSAEDFGRILRTVMPDIADETVTYMHQKCAGNGRFLRNMVQNLQLQKDGPLTKKRIDTVRKISVLAA